MNKKEGWQDADLILKEKLKLKRSFWWVPYDPDGFISARRVKYRRTAYEHCKTPHIEQYANPDEWVQGTLLEELTQEEVMEKNVKDLEKTLDLDSFQQGTFKLPQQIGESTLAATATQATQAPSTSATSTSKGKEVMDTKHLITQLPATSMEQSQEQVSPQQIEAHQVPALQTPAHEERGRKRDREDSTPASGSTQQPEVKRQRVDYPFEEEVNEEILGSPRRDREGSQKTPTRSFQ